MATKKPARKKKPARSKKPVRKKTSAGKKKGAIGRKTRRRKKVKRAKTPSRAKGTPRERRFPVMTSLDAAPSSRRGLGSSAAGQSGDTQGLSNAEEADSESVEELLEEGQTFEASVVGGVEHADADQGEVRTTQVLEDDVPREYDKD